MSHDDQRIDALPQGHQLHAYRIERVLGSGAFGITYLAEHGMFNTWHVIKEYLPDCGAREHNRSTVRPKSASDKELFDWGLKSFYEEARLLHKISHPNIVKVTDLFEANSTAYFVMPYLEGVTLHEWMKEHPNPSQAELEAIFVPLLEGLKFIHDRGLLHRDVKPENIYITDNTNPVLIDFGSARLAIGQKSKALTQVLTPHFAPWEQYRTKGTFTPALDLYSLAACMYQSITGQLPEESPDRIEGDTLPKLAGSKYEQRYAQPFLQAIDHSLAVYAKDRPQTAFAMQCELMNATPQPAPSDDPPSSLPPVIPPGPPSEPPSNPPAQPTKKSRLPLLLAGFAILALIVGLVAYKISDQQAKAKDQAQWDEARQLDTELAYEDYLANCDRCEFRPKAQGRLAEVRKAEEERRQQEVAARLAEERRKVEEEEDRRRKAEEERKQQEEAARVEEELRKAEEAARLAEERRKIEEAARLAEERRKAEEDRKRLEEEERMRKAEEERKQREEAARAADDLRKAEDARLAELERKRKAQRFTDNRDGTVTDNFTNLVWTKDADPIGPKAWDNAMAWCSSFSISGTRNWRLPTKDELVDLFNAIKGGHPFRGVQDSFYWSSTPFADYKDRAWRVKLGSRGLYVRTHSKDFNYHVWPVTQSAETKPPAAQPPSVSRFTDNGDGTVTDAQTGLMWTKDANPIGQVKWNDAAFDRFSAFSINGIGSWRLPSKDELVALHRAMLGGHPFTGVQSSYYWSSTTRADVWAFAFRVNMTSGDVDLNYKTNNNHLWPVRDSQ